MTQIIKDVVTWLKQWFYTEDEIDILLSKKKSHYYGTSQSGSTAQIKEVVSSDFVLETGAIISVRFRYAQTFSASSSNPLKLKINDEEAVNVAFVDNDYATDNMWSENEVITFVFDGTKFIMVSKGLASTSKYGVTMLTNSTSSTSTTTSATPRSVKTAYDLANRKLDSNLGIENANKNIVTGANGNIVVEAKPTIPSKISDLTNDSNFIEKKNTRGLIRNNGSIDQTPYMSVFDNNTDNTVLKPPLFRDGGTIADHNDNISHPNSVLITRYEEYTKIENNSPNTPTNYKIIGNGFNPPFEIRATINNISDNILLQLVAPNGQNYDVNLGVIYGGVPFSIIVKYDGKTVMVYKDGLLLDLESFNFSLNYKFSVLFRLPPSSSMEYSDWEVVTNTTTVISELQTEVNNSMPKMIFIEVDYDEIEKDGYDRNNDVDITEYLVGTAKIPDYSYIVIGQLYALVNVVQRDSSFTDYVQVYVGYDATDSYGYPLLTKIWGVQE